MDNMAAPYRDIRTGRSINKHILFAGVKSRRLDARGVLVSRKDKKERSNVARRQ